VHLKQTNASLSLSLPPPLSLGVGAQRNKPHHEQCPSVLHSPLLRPLP
jgi:hypothetical protein